MGRVLTALASTAAVIRHQRGGALRAGGRKLPNVLGVGFITAAYAALYSFYLLTLHATMRDGLADVGEYDQAVSGYAHLTGPHSPFVGMANAQDPGALQLSDHFTPLLALLAPGYRIHDGPQTLLIETAILAALPIIPLWLFTRRAAGESRGFGTAAAYLVVIGYGVTWPIQMALWFEFHEVFLALPIMMWMLERAQAGRLRQAASISLLLLLVKDDMGFVIAVFGVYLAAKDTGPRQWAGLVRRTAGDRRAPLRALLRRDRWALLALVPLGIGMVELVNNVLLPYFGGAPARNFTYTEFGATQGQALHAMMSDPSRVLATLNDSPLKRQTIEMLLWPVLGMCLLSPITLLALPLLLERFLSVNQLYWVMPYHYNAFLVPIMFCGGVDGAVRLSRRLASPASSGLRVRWPGSPLRGHGWVARGVLITLFCAWVASSAWLTAMRYPMKHLTDAAYRNTSTSDIVAAHAAAAHMPRGVLVAAATQVGPQLLDRDKVIMWSIPGDRDYPDTPWVLADVQRASYPFSSVDAQKSDVQWMLTEGYRIVFQDDGWVVLHRP